MDWLHDPNLVFYAPLYKLDGLKFKSEDAYGHLLTVIGAPWVIQGRAFAVNDQITASTAPSLRMGTGDLTIIAWFKAAQPSDPKAVFQFGGSVAGGKRYNLSLPDIDTDADMLEFQMDDNATNFQAKTPFTDWDSWVFFAGAKDGNTARTYVNGEAGDTLDVTGIGTLDSPNNRGLSIGSGIIESSGAITAAMTGSVGECWIYNRALNPQEIQHAYLETKWRYR